MKRTEELQKDIEAKRERLNELVASGTINDEALSASIELDKLINDYMVIKLNEYDT